MPVPWRALFCKAAGGPSTCWLAKTIRPERWFNILVGSPSHGTPKPLNRSTYRRPTFSCRWKWLQPPPQLANKGIVSTVEGNDS